MRPAEAAKAAGYAADEAWRLIRSAHIQAAIQSLAKTKATTNGLAVAVAALEEAASDPFHRDRVKAASKLLDLALPPQSRHTVTVERTMTAADKLKLLEAIALKTKQPVKALLNTLVGPNRLPAFLEQAKATAVDVTPVRDFEDEIF
jgi:hypothetical protein